MNKKYLILAIVLIIVISFTNMAKANSFNDVLNTLSDQLYWLRDRLTAQIGVLKPYIAPDWYFDSWNNSINSNLDKTIKPQLTAQMLVCSVDTDCILIETECCSCHNGGTENSTKGINKNYFSSFSSFVRNYCQGKACPTVYNCRPELTPTGAKCINNQCQAVINVTTTTTSTSTSTSTTTQPQATTDQWYKLTEFQGCKMDEWSKTCVDTNAAKNSGNAYKYCMNQYLISKKITFSDLIVKSLPADAITCMACGCEMPDIFIKAKTNFEGELNKIGFTKSNDPNEPTEKQAEDGKTTIDLSYQGLFYKEDRDTGKINYTIINKQQNLTCGDNICNALENYLYEIDLNKQCSVISEKTINFNHCPQDCKNTFDMAKAITKEEFNKIQLSCKNQTVKKDETPKETSIASIPTPPKPINTMTQTEKNEYIVTLQRYLITLLVHLRDLLIARR